jgi:ribonuclease E
MLINVSQGEECRIALVDDGKLEELYMERTSSTSHVGNIYKGRVTNVEPSIQAAFVDFGLGRNGFLHISDLLPAYFGQNATDVQESVGRKMARRDRPPIQRCLRRGDEIIVQIIKEGIGTKGPTLTTYLSVPGRILVMMPGMAQMGVSRKIEDEEERRRLRRILDSLKPPKDVGFIIRTAGVGKSKTEIQRDLTYLTRLWMNFVKKRDSGPGPMELYTEGDLVTRSVRDVFTSDIDRIIVDDKEVAKRVKEVVKLANPRTKNRVELHEDPLPLFHKYGIEQQIELMYSRHVPLPSGGSLVIDSTEAIVAIDVNSGKFREHADAETTAFKTDMEAADEIPRQLRLRDLGGVIICDFIDLRYERHRRELEARLHANFQKDRAKTKVLRMSQFGIIELTRQRMRPSLKRSIYFDCPHCKGAGLVKTPESMGLDVMRRLAIAMNDLKVARVEITVWPDVNFYLQNNKRAQIVHLEEQFGKRVVIRSDATVALDEARFDLFDARDSHVYLAELGMIPPGAVHPPARQGRHDGRIRSGRGPRDDSQRRGQQQRPDRPPPRSAQAEHGEDQFDMDNVDDELDRRDEAITDSDARPEQRPAPNMESGPDEFPEAPLANLEGESPIESSEPQPSSAGFDADEPGGNRPRRRRRGRRGRGGRNRGNDRGPLNQPPPLQDQPDGSQLPLDEPEPLPHEPAQPDSDQKPKPTGHRRRGRRGGRGRRGRGPASETRQPPAQPSTSSSHHESPRASEAPTLTKTGSADRHLVNDEPIAPQPVFRPGNVRDLDSIPDDYD